jgi:hypothetical protein
MTWNISSKSVNTKIIHVTLELLGIFSKYERMLDGGGLESIVFVSKITFNQLKVESTIIC